MTEEGVPLKEKMRNWKLEMDIRNEEMDERGKVTVSWPPNLSLLSSLASCVMSEVIDLTIDSGSDFESVISAINSP